MPEPAGTGLSRRSLLLRSVGLGLSVYGAGAIAGADHVQAAIQDALGEHKVLMSVFVDGGWDSLSVLAPFGTDHTHEARLAALRPGLSGAIARASAVPFAPDPSLSWHPSAAGLRGLWDDPTVGVAVAPAVGYAGANYSHFTSRHFWEIGNLDYGGSTGWIGRYLDRVGQANVPIQGVSLTPTLSPVLATQNVPVSAISDPATYALNYNGTWGNLPTSVNSLLAEHSTLASGDVQRDQARLVSGASLGLLDELSSVSQTAASAVPYPTDSSDFIDQLKTAAKLLGTRVGGAALPIRSMTLRAHGSYDTHQSETATLSTNLRITGDAIRAFWADLQARGEDDRVVMLVWSEFGRRPQENSSNGSDHGAAGTAFVIGKNVKQGMIGSFPGLKAYGTTDAGLMQDGNLRATSDFRGIYSALLEQWLDTDASGIIPGAGAKPGAGAFVRPALL